MLSQIKHQTVINKAIFGLVQGLFLYFGIQYFHHPVSTGITIFFVINLLGLEFIFPTEDHLFKLLGWLSLIAIIYALSGIYFVHYQSQIAPGFSSVILLQYLLSAYIAFVFYLVFVEQKRCHFPYSSLFNTAWNVLLIILLSLLFSFLLWGLLFFISALFVAIDIPQIMDFITSKPFIYISLPCFFGIGIGIIEPQQKILNSLRNILLTFSKFLYPVLVVCSLIFMIAAIVMRKPLSDYWGMYLGIATLHIFLFNGVYQDGKLTPPYTKWFRWLIGIFIFVLPIFVLVTCYIPLRVMYDYGIKIDALYQFIIQIIILCYAFSYPFAYFVAKDKTWLNLIKKINPIVAIIMAFIYLLQASPILDLGKITVRNQTHRLLNGEAIFDKNNPLNDPGFLKDADLKGANLQGKNLTYTNLAGANLQNVNLSKANLKGTSFIKAKLSHANLQNANMQYAKLSKANLTNANLQNSNLESAWFMQANLQGVNFSGANLKNAFGLTQKQLDKACGSNVVLPPDLTIKACASNNVSE